MFLVQFTGLGHLYAQQGDSATEAKQEDVAMQKGGDVSEQRQTDAKGGEDAGAKTPAARKPAFYMAIGGGLLLIVENGSLFGDTVARDENTVIDADPNPLVFAFNFNIGVPIKGNNFFSLYVTPKLDLYWTYYIWNDDIGKPLPAAAENRNEFVLGFFTGVDAEVQMVFGKSLLLFADLGIAADMRLVMVADGLNETDPLDKIADDVKKVKNYFFSAGRPFYFHAGLGVGLRSTQKYSIAVNLNMWLPFVAPEHRTGDSALLGWRFGMGVKITRNFIRGTNE
jgi:hypothetical protein